MDKLKKLEAEFDRLRKDLCNISYFKKGSISRCYQTCGNKSCRCYNDKEYRHGPYFLWTSKENNKSKSILVPELMVKEALGYIEDYKKLKQLIKRMEEVSEEIFKIRIREYKTKTKNYK